MLYLDEDIIDNQEKFFKSFWPIINFQKENKNKIGKLDYKDFFDSLVKYFEHEKVSEIQIHLEILDYKNVLKNLLTIFIIIFILENKKFVIFNDKNDKKIKYLLYNQNIQKFTVLKKKEFSNQIKNMPCQIFLCEKIFDENKKSFEEQNNIVEKKIFQNVKKRKVPSGFEEEKEKKEKEDNKNFKKNRKKRKK